MKIGIVAPPWFPVPPEGYGGIERVVSILADGLVAAGNEVTLFASGDSRTVAKLSSVFPTAPSASIGQTLPELQHVLHALAHARGFDVIHDHTGMLVAPLVGGLVDVPFVHTVHGSLEHGMGELYQRLCSLAPTTKLVSLSWAQRLGFERLPWVGNCPNAVDLSMYPFDAEVRKSAADGPLLFLGRMSDDKGAHRAIELARAAGLPLRIAAKCRDPAEHVYFEREVKPRLGGNIEYVGEVGHTEKVELLQSARALLMPISWEEPFGMVMIEAMACGTPVIATRRGAVPEVVQHGVSGLIVDEWEQMGPAITAVRDLDPVAIRADAEQRFSGARLVEDTIHVYETLLGRRGVSIDDEVPRTGASA